MERISTPFLSIIVPIFNNEDTLEDCLQAITNIKDFQNCELIVADDASTDSSINIAQQYKAKIISLPYNNGVAFARNMAATVAIGEILFFVDSDVVLLANDIVRHLKEDFDSSKICGVVGLYDKKVMIDSFLSAYKHLYMCFSQELLPKFVPVASSAILAVGRENFLEASGFNEKYKGVMAEDIEFSIRLALKENKLFLVDSRIKGQHVKKYNIETLLYTDYYRIKGIHKTIQTEDYKKVYFKGCSRYCSIPPLLMALTAGFFILSLFWPVFNFAVLILILLFILSQIKFFNYLRKHKNIGFAILAIGFSFCEMLFAVGCVLYLQIVDKLKRE